MAISCYYLVASVFRLFTHQTRHLVSSFNMENDQRIKARLLRWFPAILKQKHDFRSCLFGFSIPTVYLPNKTLGVVIQYGKWSAHQGASFGMVSSHFRKMTDFRLQYFRQLAIDFPIKIRFGICSKQLLAMKNRFLTLPKSEKLHFVEFMTI